MTLYAVLVLVGVHLTPYTYVRGNELVLQRALNIAILLGLVSVLVGILFCTACSWLKVEPPPRLVNFTVLAIVVFAFIFVLSPAIGAA